MSGLLRVKLIRDLRASWSRFLLMILAIAISLTAFGSVLFAWAASSRETRSGYASTEPASATILLDRPIAADAMAAIVAAARQRPGVLEATGRTQFSSAVTINDRTRRTPMQLFVAAPDDPLRMAKFFLQQSTWPPSPDELLVGRDSLALLGVSIGDMVSIEAPTGEQLRLRVADTVYDPSLSPSPQEQTGRGYLSAASLGSPGRQGELDQLKIQVAARGSRRASENRDAIVKVASEVGAWLQSDRGLTIREIQVPKPKAHPHQWQADALLLSMLAGGAAALLLSTLLVANMLNNLFTQQIPQIGIMKAIGAPSDRIGRLYLSMTLVVAVAATAFAVVPARLLGRAAVTNFLGFLGIEATDVAAPLWTYLVVVAVGLGLPPLMALIPLVKTSRTTVRAAIDHHGGGVKPGARGGVLARLGRVQRFDRGLLLALRNTFRRPARFLLAAGLLACAGTVFVAGVSLSAGTNAIAEEQKHRRDWDVDVALDAPVLRADIAFLVKQVSKVRRIEALDVAQTGLAGPGDIPVTRTYPDQGHGRVAVTALPADSTMTPPTLLEGRWLRRFETGAVVLNQVTRKNTLPGVHAGDRVQLIIDGKKTTWQVVGLAQEREGGGGGVYTTAEGLAAATGQPARVNQLRIFTTGSDEQTREAVADAVTASLLRAGVKVRSAASISRSEAVSAGHLGPIILILLGVALPLGIVGVIGLASTMSANVLDRTREFGIMHAIGARPKTVRRIVATEGVFLAITSCLVAVVPTLALTAFLGAGLGDLFFSAPLPYRISLRAVGIWTAVAVLGSILATEAAASRASRITVREALTYI